MWVESIRTKFKNINKILDKRVGIISAHYESLFDKRRHNKF